MELRARVFKLFLSEPFVISRSTDTEAEVVQVALSHNGLVGYGEGAPDAHYGESVEGAADFLEGIADRLGDDPLATAAILSRVGEIPGHMGAKCALDGALHDLLGKI